MRSSNTLTHGGPRRQEHSRHESKGATAGRRFEQARDTRGELGCWPCLHLESRHAPGVERVGKHPFIARQPPTPETPDERRGFAIDSAVRVGEEIHELTREASQI